MSFYLSKYVNQLKYYSTRNDIYLHKIKFINDFILDDKRIYFWYI